jgi:hypothetical protein
VQEAEKAAILEAQRKSLLARPPPPPPPEVKPAGPDEDVDLEFDPD